MQFNPNLVPVLVLFALAAAQRANADLAGLSCADGIKPDSARCPHIAAALKQLLPVDTPPLKCIYERQFGTSNAETCITVAAALNALDDVEGFSCIYKYMLVSDSCPASIVALGQMVSTTVNATSTTLSTTTATGTSTTATVSLPHQIVCPVSETGEVQSSFVDCKPQSRSLLLSLALSRSLLLSPALSCSLPLSRSLYVCLPFFFCRFSFIIFSFTSVLLLRWVDAPRSWWHASFTVD